MSIGRRPRVLAIATAVVALGALGLVGSGSAGTDPTTGLRCSPKPLCASMTFQDDASRSPAGSAHYFSDSVTVSYDNASGATSTLTNLRFVLTWTDVGSSVGTTSEYVEGASDPECVPDPAGTPYTVVCTAPKSLRPGDPPLEFDPLVFRTASEASAASGTQVTFTATGKEQFTPKKGAPNEAVVVVQGLTSYEGLDDRDISVAGGGLTAGGETTEVTLATQQTGCEGASQFSELPVPADADRGFYEVLERCYGGTNGATCPDGYTCFGQHVDVTASGLSPVNLQMTYVGRLPSGATEGSIVVFHDLDFPDEDGLTTHFISDACSGGFGERPPDEEIYCRRVTIDHLSGGIAEVHIDAWDWDNGGWGNAG